VNKSKEYDWCFAKSLLAEAPLLIPADYCFLNYQSSRSDEPLCFSDTNGCSAGNTVEEAIYNGLLELIERDAVSIWWYNRLCYPEIVIESLESEFVKNMAQSLSENGRTMHILDISTDLLVPCVVAVSYKTLTRDNILFGFGCNVQLERAVQRACYELGQLLSAHTFERIPGMTHWLKADLEAVPYLLPGMQNGSREQTYTNQPETLYSLAKCCEAEGISIFWVDLSRRECNFSVVRVVAPGLRSMTPRFAPGRLYDVPVKLGLLERKNTEANMNPIPMFL
jgi:ribosomal protein S12 methylthiotransferase accessory factor